jgi:hypothetical protein
VPARRPGGGARARRETGQGGAGSRHVCSIAVSTALRQAVAGASGGRSAQARSGGPDGRRAPADRDSRCGSPAATAGEREVAPACRVRQSLARRHLSRLRAGRPSLRPGPRPGPMRPAAAARPQAAGRPLRPSGSQDPYGNRAGLHRYPVRLLAWARIRHDQGPSAPRCNRGAHLLWRCERTDHYRTCRRAVLGRGDAGCTSKM